MGCDIHVCCEVYDEKEQRWRNIDHYKINRYYNKNSEEDYDRRKWEQIPAYDGRNYKLFGILAGVRDETVEPIRLPKGFPYNASKQTKKEYVAWGSDAHTPSYLTLREMFEYLENNNTVTYSGMVDKQTAEKLDKDGEKPKEWCQWVSDTLNYTYREWEADTPLKRFIECILERFDEDFWVFDFLSEDEKKKRRENYQDRCRVVFWFDN